MSRNPRIVIIGAGGQAKIYTEIIELLNENLIGYVSSEPKGTIINGYEVLCDIDTFVSSNNSIKADALIVSIGDNIIRNDIYLKLNKLGLKNINLIHPKAIVSDKAKLGEGIYIGAGAVISPGTCIGDFSTIGVNASVEHDSIIGCSVNIAPGVNIAGKVKFGDFSVAGIGSTIIEKVNIGSYSILGAGSTAISDVPNDVVAYGLPAKPMQNRDKSKTYLK